MRKQYCWRCKTEVPMLDEKEWEELAPFINQAIMPSLKFEKNKGKSIKERFAPALEKYFQLTGYKETNQNAIAHHQLSQFGPLCPKCLKPYRTPRASFCAECGNERGDIE
jgi:hypothetical protein